MLTQFDSFPREFPNRIIGQSICLLNQCAGRIDIREVVGRRRLWEDVEATVDFTTTQQKEDDAHKEQNEQKNGTRYYVQLRFLSFVR